MASKNTSRRVPRIAPSHDFSVETGWLEMPDGIRLATTTYSPKPRFKGEKFPVLLEILPYRKDDTFYAMDYPTYSYFAQRGYITVKVDIRGTGASHGQIPPCEYSKVELDDAEEIIRQLAELPRSNGSVCMWGISWSGFNSIQVAMRRPPQLKAIIAMHASDDLYHDDLHYVDGVVHLDPYHLFINHELGLPRTPDYKLDDEYLIERLGQKPWLFTYLKQQEDGAFWRNKSLRYRGYHKIDIPVYIIGGLLDGYRDTVLRLLENLEGPVRADIGPWAHYSPDDGDPGPNYEWQDEALRWLKPFMFGKSKPVEPSKRKQLLVFVRDGHEPDANQEVVPGSFRLTDWPVRNSKKKTFYPTRDKRLASRPKGKAVDRMTAIASSGTAAGPWWGDKTGDMKADDVHGLVYDSAPVTNKTVIVGFPEVKLLVSSDATSAHWSVRLEDVAPDGKVNLVTGALVNGAHLTDRLPGAKLEPGEVYELKTNLHFTTWTFRQGHKIRLVVSNAQFPMAWPSPVQVTSQIHTGSTKTALTLPVVPSRFGAKANLPKVAEKLPCPDADSLERDDGKPESDSFICRHKDGRTSFVMETNSLHRVKRRKFYDEIRNSWTTNDNDQANSAYEGLRTTTIQSGKRTIRLKTVMRVQSDLTHFHVTLRRELRSDGKLVATRQWQESIERRLH